MRSDAFSLGQYLRSALYTVVVGIVIFVAGMPACDGARPGHQDSQQSRQYSTGSGHNVAREMVHDGLIRKYLLYIPDSLEQVDNAPLVLVFHGGFGSGKRIAGRVGMNAIADREKFIVAYPDAVDRHWNDGRSTTASGADDVAFILALIERIRQTYSIDEKRIYASGLSNGGYLTTRLACESSDVIAAFAPVISTMPVPLNVNCKPGQPVPVMMINGRDDPLVPWQGGALSSGKRMGGKGGEVISVPDTIEFWRRHNNCSEESAETLLPDKDPGDGTLVKQTAYENCDAGSEVVLLTVIGGGHTWPGAPERRRMNKRTGRTSYDINASEVIWNFFKRQALN
jgi:polyhydroxybutyrate depolymerase